MIWCLHGAVGSAEDWKLHARRWAEEGETVRRVDLWRYLDCGPLSLEEFARAFREEVRAAGEGCHRLVAYSMGARLALHVLLEDCRDPLFRKAVLVAPHPGLPDEESRLRRMARDAEWAALALAGDWGDFLRKWNAQPVFETGAPEGGLDRHSLQARRQAVARSFMDWSLGKQADLRSRLAEIAIPVLWVTGGRDEKFAGLAAECVGLLPEGRHVCLGDSGHRVPWEAEAAFAGLAADFLRTG